MELSAEDALRLNVLLANKPLAIRINESSMTLFGLMADGEARIRLNPTTSDEKYLRQVRSILSERALGSPVSYPLYLQRWTRMGRMRDESLNELLKLGDPAAVFAVVCAEGLTDELARRAWWAAEEPENARRMLQTEAVVQGQTGRVLARYLVGYLPFESETETMIESVGRVLQPGLPSERERLDLWNKATRKTPYLVGFIAAIPDDLPDRLPDRADYRALLPILQGLAGSGNTAARLLEKSLASAGQTFLAACSRILAKPPTQDVVTTTLEVIRQYYGELRGGVDPDLSIEALQAEAMDYCAESASARELVERTHELMEELQAIHLLSGVGYGVIRPVLGGSDAIGSLMRRKMAPVLDGVLERIGRLLGREGGPAAAPPGRSRA